VTVHWVKAVVATSLKFQLHDRVGAAVMRGLRGMLAALRGRLFLVIDQIFGGHVSRRAIAAHVSVMHPQRMLAQLLDMIGAVRTQQEGAAVGEILFLPRDAFLLERFVADCEHFVGDQDLRADRGRDSEAEPHDHA